MLTPFLVVSRRRSRSHAVFRLRITGVSTEGRAEGETPKIPPKIPMNEMLGQKVEELPWSMGSKFLSDFRLSAEEQEAFADW